MISRPGPYRPLAHVSTPETGATRNFAQHLTSCFVDAWSERAWSTILQRVGALICSNQKWYPLVNLQKAIENGHWNLVDFPINSMVLIFHCYVTLHQRVHHDKSTHEARALKVSYTVICRKKYSPINHPIWVCLKIVYPIVPNGFADHYPGLKWLFHWEYLPNIFRQSHIISFGFQSSGPWYRMWLKHALQLPISLLAACHGGDSPSFNQRFFQHSECDLSLSPRIVWARILSYPLVI